MWDDSVKGFTSPETEYTSYSGPQDLRTSGPSGPQDLRTFLSPYPRRCVHAVVEDLQALRFPIRRSFVSTLRPLGMLERVEECIRMGHQTEQSPARVADPGDGVLRTVGVVWPLCRRIAGAIDIPQSDEALLGQSLAYTRIGEELALAVATGQVDELESPGPDAG